MPTSAESLYVYEDEDERPGEFGYAVVGGEEYALVRMDVLAAPGFSSYVALFNADQCKEGIEA